jgi:hypothetical protein
VGVCGILDGKALIDVKAHLARPRVTELDRCPIQKLGTASLPNLNRMWHQGLLNFLRFVTENSKFHKFIILTMMLLFPHDSAIR